MRFTVKNISRLSLSMVVLSCLVLSTACKKEPVYPDPTIEFNTSDGLIYSDTTIALNEIMKFGINMKSGSDDSFLHFNINVDRDGQIATIDTTLLENEYSVELNVPKSLAELETWTFYCRDRDGRESEHISLKIKLDSNSVFNGIKYIPMVDLGAQDNDDKGSFYSLSQNEVMILSDAFANQEAINLAYYFDTLDADKNTISSPGANIDATIFSGIHSIPNWTTRNTTRFVQRGDISLEEFEASRNDSLILANSFDFSTGKRKAKKLVKDNIYSFATETGQKGLFLVKEVVGEDTGSIKIAVKMLDE